MVSGVCLRCVHCVVVCASVVSGVFLCEVSALWSGCVVSGVCLCEVCILCSVCL